MVYKHSYSIKCLYTNSQVYKIIVLVIYNNCVGRMEKCKLKIINNCVCHFSPKFNERIILLLPF